MLKWIIRILAGLIVLALAAALASAGWLGSRFILTQPKMEGVVSAPGLPSGATIVRDEYGVAHIFGETDEDVFFALGYVHAQERFFQMDLVRRSVYGTLSELFGERALSADARARIRGDHLVAQRQADMLNPAARASVEAYVAGVNARLAEGTPSPEYAILRKTPEPWRLEDTAGLTVSFANMLMGAGAELNRAALQDTLDEEQLDQFLTMFPDWAPTSIKDEDLARIFEGREPQGPGAAAQAYGQPGAQPGSNGWIVSGERSATGAPMLTNDPHLALSSPSIWFYARLELEDGPVVGATSPGAPYVILGRNAYGAWGSTNAAYDVQDFVPADPAGASIRQETINIAGGDPVVIDVAVTEDGPILQPEYFNLPENSGPLALRRTIDLGEGDNGGSIYAIMRSTGWQSFRNALRGYVAPIQNFHYAGVDGTIGYMNAGLIPIRDEDGTWTGFVPFEDMPHVVNPQSGMIASGNNRVVSDAYPYPAPGRFFAYRALRIEERLNAVERHDLDSFAGLQMDVTSSFAQRVLPALRSARPETQAGLEALALLEDWDGSLPPDRPEPLIYAAWIRELNRAVMEDELGEATGFLRSNRWHLLDRALTGDAADWCDDIRTAQPESCPVILGWALDAAAAELVAAYGEDMDAWRWGEVRGAIWGHPLSGLPLIGALFETSVPVGGDATTVNVAGFGGEDFNARGGVSFRAIYDLSDLNNSRFIHGPGQSGHPLSRHHDDLAEMWATGGYFEIRDDWTPESPPEGARTLRLTPQ